MDIRGQGIRFADVMNDVAKKFQTLGPLAKARNRRRDTEVQTGSSQEPAPLL